MTTRRTSRSFAALFATALLAISITACAPTASSPTSSAPGAGGGGQNFSAERDAYDLEVAKCLRGKGLDVKDPQPGKGIQESSPEIDAAVPACLAEAGEPPVAGGKLSDAEQLTIWLEESACFREKGYEVEEPALNQAYTIPEDATEADVAACISAAP